VDEVMQSDIQFDCIVLSVGGGGLLSGVVEGLKAHGLSTPVIAIETEGADSLAQAVEAGQLIVLPAITSIASSLGAKQVCENAFNIAHTHDIRCGVVKDLEAIEACERFLLDHRILVEPACGASLAAVYSTSKDLLSDFRSPLIVVCGGATATPAQLDVWHQNLTKPTP
jgi:L-serine/L-threonine ammonia-lyase